MTEMRRLDRVVLRLSITAAGEIDQCNPLTSSYEKLLDVPADILRVVVLRRRCREIRLSRADRCNAVRSHLRMVSWLCDGRVTDMQLLAGTHRTYGEVVPLREKLVVAAGTGGNHGSRR